MNLFEAYCRGQRLEVWEELQHRSITDLADTNLLEDARAIATLFMQRVRANIELLIPRWEQAGHVFGYDWAKRHLESIDRLARLTPRLGEPNQADRMILQRFEQARGPLPIALSTFYEVVGSVNFVGKIASGWPDMEQLDPLQVLAFSPQVDALVSGESDAIEIAEDFLHKFGISGLDSLVVNLPCQEFDPALVLDGQALEADGRLLTFGGYLRSVILERGGIGSGADMDAPDPELLRYLTVGLQPF